MHLRHIGALGIIASGVESRLRPVIIERAVGPLLKEIRFILRCCRHRRVPWLPGHTRKPLVQVNRFKGRAALRIRQHARALQGIVVRPGSLLELEGAALANPTLIGIGKAARIHKHGRQARRIEAGECHLGMGGIRQSHGTDAAIAPGLLHEPGAGIVAIRGLGKVFRKDAFRAIAATTILIDHHVAMLDKEGRHFLAGFGTLRVVAGDFRATRLPFPVRRAFENDGERPGNDLPCGRGTIDIARQLDPISHRDHDIAFNPHVVVHTLTLALDMAPCHAALPPLCQPPHAMTTTVLRRPRWRFRGGQVDARERCVYNTSLYYHASWPGLMMHDAHWDDLCSWSRGLAWARMQRQTQEDACDAITTWVGSRRGPSILPTTPWSPGPRHSPLL